jgi:hypothetical protein
MRAKRADPAPRTAALHALLDRGMRHAPEYRGGLSDHRPMTLTALHALGADDAALQRFDAAYTPRLEPAATEGNPPGDDRTAHRGSIDACPHPIATMRSRLGAHPTAQVPVQVLPIRMDGVGAGAFHGLIRTAYGVAVAPADRGAALAAYVRPYVAAARASGTEPDVEGRLSDSHDRRPDGHHAAGWQRPSAAALRSDDEHCVQLVDSCRDEARACNSDAPCLQAAQAVTGTSG